MAQSDEQTLLPLREFAEHLGLREDEAIRLLKHHSQDAGEQAP